MRLAWLLAAASFAAAGAEPGTAAPPETTLVLDAGQRFQKMDGFGASSFAGFEAFERGYFDQVTPAGVTYKTTEKQRAAILATAIRELGVSHVRLWLPPAGIENTNDNDDPRVMNWAAFTWAGDSGKPASERMLENRRNGLVEWGGFLKTAVPLGLKNWIVTPGGMPEWLAEKWKTRAPDRFEEYAEWAAAQLLFLKKEFGLEAPYWSLYNEPDNLGWVAPELWLEWIKTTGARFRKEGLKTKLMVPDFMNAARAVPLAAAILKDDEARPYIGALAYHHYATSGDGPQPFLEMTSSPRTAEAGPLFDRITGPAREMAALGRKYGLPSWQTETGYYIAHYKTLSEWEIGRGRANEIYYELRSGAAAVEGMFLFWPDAVDPRYGASCRSEGHPIVVSTDGRRLNRWEVTKDAGAVFAHFGRFVRPGDWRIAASCPDAMIRATAFVSDKNRRWVAVIVNNAPTPRSVVCRVEGVPWKPAYFGALLTDQEKTLAPHAVAALHDGANSLRVELPASSLCTIVWSATDPGRLELPADVLKR